jgi:hypothetical protein
VTIVTTRKKPHRLTRQAAKLYPVMRRRKVAHTVYIRGEVGAHFLEFDAHAAMHTMMCNARTIQRRRQEADLRARIAAGLEAPCALSNFLDDEMPF